MFQWRGIWIASPWTAKCQRLDKFHTRYFLSVVLESRQLLVPALGVMMPRRLALVPVFLFLCLNLSAQQRTGPGPSRGGLSQKYSIRGQLRSNETSQPLEMVKVQLVASGGETMAIQFTRSNGEFEFSGLGSGVYRIAVDLEGYQPLRETVEITNGSRYGVTLFVTRTTSQPQPEPSDPISAHELALPQKARDSRQKGDERLFQKGDSRGSIPYFEKAIFQAPGYYEAYFDLGLAHLRSSENELAEQSFRKSIELSDNKFAPPQQALAALLCDRKDFEPAELLARHSLEIGGMPAEGHFELGRALYGLNRVDDAEKEALAARKGKPEYAEVNLLLANIHIHKRNYPALLEDLDTYLKLKPEGPESDHVRTMRQKVELALTDTRNNSPQ